MEEEKFSIVSRHNPLVQNLREIGHSKKPSTGKTELLVEGVRTIEEAFQMGYIPSMTIYSPDLSERGRSLIQKIKAQGSPTHHVPGSLLQYISQTEHPQGILASVPYQFGSTFVGIHENSLLLDSIRDPGNLGTILRTAAAAGVTSVILTPGTVDATNSKVIRSAMGAHFYLTIFLWDWQQIETSILQPENAGCKIFLADPQKGTPPWEADLTSPHILIIGSEAEGASQDAQRIANQYICIPLTGRIESLNAATATNILLYETLRQRINHVT